MKKVISKIPLSEQLHKKESSRLKKYQEKAIGDTRLMSFFKYELVNILSGNLSGSLGYLLRKRFYSCLLKNAGNDVIFGKGIVLRHPGNISIGDRTAIDDYALIDASGAGEKGIQISDDCIISRNCVVQGKEGSVFIGCKADIGCNTIISSIGGTIIGESVLIAGNCYIGGSQYLSDRLDVPMMDQGIYTNGPINISDDVWLGAGVSILDGVKIGRGSIIGAGAVVTKDIPEYSIAVGIPAKVIKKR